MTLHTELRSIPQKVQDPMMRLIRLQWWRDEIEKMKNGCPYSESPVLEELFQCQSFLGFDNYFNRFDQSLRGQESDIDEIFYTLMTSVIQDEKSKNHFVKKLMHHDQLNEHTSFRALRLWLGV
jgi:hypothetical protein